MNLKEQINSQLLIFLRGMEDGEVFRVDDFNAVHRFNASQLSRVLSVMAEQGIVVKLSKGVYAKGSGDGKPLHPEDMIRDCIFDNTGGRVGYLTGHSYLVSAGLVKDYRDKIAVAVAKKRGDISRGGMTFRFVEQPLPINDQTYELLQMLDALRGINRVGAEVSSDAVYEHVKANIKLMSPARVDPYDRVGPRLSPHGTGPVGFHCRYHSRHRLCKQVDDIAQLYYGDPGESVARCVA